MPDGLLPMFARLLFGLSIVNGGCSSALLVNGPLSVRYRHRPTGGEVLR